MSDTPSFAKLVPGFEFLQGLVKNAGAALPSMGQWVAPTLNPDELQKRIDELKTVQFWLDQNAKMLGTTIQALEVQRMTLSTLKTMNVQMTDLREAMKVPPVSAAAEAVTQGFGAEALMQAAKTAMGGMGAALGKSPFATPAAPARAERAETPEKPETTEKPAAKAEPAGKPENKPEDKPATPGMVDPMQWWGALTKQFTQLAANAMKDPAGDAAANLAGAMMKQGIDAAGETLKKAVAMPAEVAQKAMSAAGAAALKTPAAKAPAKTAARRPAAKKRAEPGTTAAAAAKTRAR